MLTSPADEDVWEGTDTDDADKDAVGKMAVVGPAPDKATGADAAPNDVDVVVFDEESAAGGSDSEWASEDRRRS